MRILLVIIAVAAAGCLGTRGPVQVAGAPGVTIPAGVKSALDERWRGWQIVAPPAETACAGRFDTPPGAVVSGDWDGDGTTDLAFQISSPDGRRLVAALARLEGAYALIEVAAVEDEAGVLGVKHRARSYRHQANGIEHFYNVDTLVFGVCKPPDTGYFWTGGSFEGRPVF